MLAARNRLRSSKEIRTVLKQGACFSGKYMRLCASPSTKGTFRTACVVGKTVSPLAVRRHYYQRVLREAVKNVMLQNSANKPFDMVLIALPSIVDAKNLETIENELKELMLKYNKFNEKK